MPPLLSTTNAVAAILWLSLIAFAVLGGADFGAGVWDLLARGTSGERQRGALIRAIGPIWEGNEIWLIYLITGTFTAFSLVFSTIMTAFFIPIAIALLGIVMRGAAFVFYSHFRENPGVNHGWGRTFSVAATITPFLFGAVAAGAADGSVRVDPNEHVHANVITSWTSPFSVSCGLFAVALCACLAATYMTVEARNQRLTDVLAAFRVRALISGAVAALLAAVSAVLAHADAPYLFSGLTSRALPLVLGAIVVGIVMSLALLLRFFSIARVLSAGLVMLVLGGWSVAQLPYLIVPDVTISRAASAPGIQAAVLIASIVGMLLVLPAQWYMLHLYKSPNRSRPPVTPEQLMETLRKRDELAAATWTAKVQADGHAPSAVVTTVGRNLVRWLGRAAAATLVTLGVSVVQRWWMRMRATHPTRARAEEPEHTPT